MRARSFADIGTLVVVWGDVRATHPVHVRGVFVLEPRAPFYNISILPTITFPSLLQAIHPRRLFGLIRLLLDRLYMASTSSSRSASPQKRGREPTSTKTTPTRSASKRPKFDDTRPAESNPSVGAIQRPRSDIGTFSEPTLSGSETADAPSQLKSPNACPKNTTASYAPLY